MLYLLAGVVMIIAAGVSGWYVRPVNGQLSPRVSVHLEPYVAIGIVGLIIFGCGALVLGTVQTLS